MVKIIGDGTQDGYTAWLLEPYADKPDSIGASPFTEEQWHQLVGQVDAAGFDVHVHACGERTARVALDSIEAAIATNPPRDRRHTVAHLVYVEDPDSRPVRRTRRHRPVLRELDVGRPGHLQNMGARYGAPRKDLFYRPQEVLKSGGRISLGTDWPAAGYYSTYKPLDSIQIGVTRQLDRRSPTLRCWPPPISGCPSPRRCTPTPSARPTRSGWTTRWARWRSASSPT